MATFKQFFRTATRSKQEPDGREPYPFQERFAEANNIYHLLSAPTGFRQNGDNHPRLAVAVAIEDTRNSSTVGVLLTNACLGRAI